MYSSPTKIFGSVLPKQFFQLILNMFMRCGPTSLWNAKSQVHKMWNGWSIGYGPAGPQDLDLLVLKMWTFWYRRLEPAGP